MGRLTGGSMIYGTPPTIVLTREHYEELTRENEKGKLRIAELRDELSRKREECNRALAERDDWKRKHAKLMEFDDGLIKAANAENEKLKAKVAEFGSQRNSLIQQRFELQDKLRAASLGNKKLAEDNEKLKAKCDSFCSELIKGQNETILKRRDEISRLSSALTEQEACTGREIERTASVAKTVDRLAVKLSWAEAAANEYRRKLDDLEPRLADALEDCDSLKAEVKRLKKKLGRIMRFLFQAPERQISQKQAIESSSLIAHFHWKGFPSGEPEMAVGEKAEPALPHMIPFWRAFIS